MRDALIQAAIEKFGARGFEAVGTREIAAAVGTPMSSITYHFGSKEGLYLAAAEHIFDKVHEDLAPVFHAMPEEDATTSDHVDAVCNTIGNLGRFMLEETTVPFALFINREQQAPTKVVREMMDRKVMPMLRHMVAQVRLIRPELSEDEARALGFSLFSLCAGLRHGHASLNLLFGCEKLDQPTKDLLIGQLQRWVRTLLLAEEPA